MRLDVLDTAQIGSTLFWALLVWRAQAFVPVRARVVTHDRVVRASLRYATIPCLPCIFVLPTAIGIRTISSPLRFFTPDTPNPCLLWCLC